MKYRSREVSGIVNSVVDSVVGVVDGVVDSAVDRAVDSNVRNIDISPKTILILSIDITRTQKYWSIGYQSIDANIDASIGITAYCY